MAAQRCRRYAKHVMLGRIGISDEAAIDDRGGAGNFGKRRGNQPTGAGFRSGDFQISRAAQIEHPPCAAAQALFDHGPLHGSRTVAVAIATMPSPRPVKPSRSLVVAFTAARATGIPAMAAMRPRMASRCGEIFGASQTMVTSR